uniref:Uncharacterized protein n=1 Tax=Parascaris univalens TaxID=6257 RepID=A0A915BLE9_PARUN
MMASKLTSHCKIALGNHESSTRLSHRAAYHVWLCVFSIYTLLWFMDGQCDIHLRVLLFTYEKSDSLISIPHMGCRYLCTFYIFGSVLILLQYLYVKVFSKRSTGYFTNFDSDPFGECDILSFPSLADSRGRLM